ncbi:MAG: hypothetical protein IPQ07_24550 [Myxococcales bacterium]|nr:hypothetical protein [Myxococcales bacterium]
MAREAGDGGRDGRAVNHQLQPTLRGTTSQSGGYDDLACEPGDSVYIEHVDHAWSEYSDADTYRNPIDLAAGGTERFEVHIVHGCGETSPASPIASLTATGAVVVTQVGPTTFEVQAISEGGSSIQIVTEGSGRPAGRQRLVPHLRPRSIAG